MVQNFSPTVFNQLNDFQVARKHSVDCQAVLPRLGKIICQYGLNDKIGLSLLHKHFSLDHQERLIEQFYGDKTKIQPLTIPNETITPYLWKPQNINNNFNWYPLEFCLTSHLPPSIIALASGIVARQDFLKAMVDTLLASNIIDVFGITILHRAIKVTDDKILVETTNEKMRTLTWAAWPRSSFAPQELTPTTWRFDSNGQIVEAHNCWHCSHSIGVS